jgi:hypothetical protein
MSDTVGFPARLDVTAKAKAEIGDAQHVADQVGYPYAFSAMRALAQLLLGEVERLQAEVDAWRQEVDLWRQQAEDDPASRHKSAYTAAALLADHPPRQEWQAPFTDEQVRLLNAHQRSNHFHPYTCGDHTHRGQPLVASTAGWTCPEPECPYTQNWAHAISGSVAEMLLADLADDQPGGAS